MIEIDYEVIGYDGDDGEMCAGANSKDEAYRYAMQYREDYERVEVVKVIREVECTVFRGFEMTQDEIIRMAREAGIETDWSFDFKIRLERFAALVAAHERQKFMDLCEAEYKEYDELVTEEDVGREEATAIIHLMRKLEGMK